jgi:hypothetical protein
MSALTIGELESRIRGADQGPVLRFGRFVVGITHWKKRFDGTLLSDDAGLLGACWSVFDGSS